LFTDYRTSPRSLSRSENLKHTFPLLRERIKQAQQERQKKLKLFYEQGAVLGLFRPLSPALAILQDGLLLRNIMDPVFLMEHDLTLRTPLHDYYELQKYQWLVPEVSGQIDDAPIKEYIDMIVRKISLGMRSESGR
jgi:hypothetical protein